MLSFIKYFFKYFCYAIAQKIGKGISEVTELVTNKMNGVANTYSKQYFVLSQAVCKPGQ